MYQLCTFCHPYQHRLHVFEPLLFYFIFPLCSATLMTRIYYNSIRSQRKIFSLEHSLRTVVYFINWFSSKFCQYIGKDKVEGLCRKCPVRRTIFFLSLIEIHFFNAPFWFIFHVFLRNENNIFKIKNDCKHWEWCEFQYRMTPIQLHVSFTWHPTRRWEHVRCIKR